MSTTIGGVGASRTNSRIVAKWLQRTPTSAAFAQQASTLFPSGITHDARQVEPYGPYVERARGGHKWDVDGNRYVDFYGGHGALILGHAHPVVIEKVTQAVAEGSQFAAGHEHELRWARAVRRLVPSIERLRFTSSGTEATLMALRLARAFTGRDKIMRFKGHFHGWHDHMTTGWVNHFDGTPTPGVLAGVAGGLVLATAGDLAEVELKLAGGGVAAVIVEPTGASFGQVPLRPEFMHGLRAATARHGTLLIMDEVVTGFRVSSGGAQQALGIVPDLTSLAKIVAGGMPGAAVGGRKDILDLLDFEVAKATGREKIGHQGTFNANPISAVAGAATLEIIAANDVSGAADALAAKLRAALNAVLAREGVQWAVYGTSSGFHFFLNPQQRDIDPEHFDPFACTMDELKTPPAQLMSRLRLALLVNGVDVSGRLSGFTSIAHTDDDIAETAAALTASIRMLREEAELA
jgi:glutamate-1-semialdehyde 2,1-aminomutase